MVLKIGILINAFFLAGCAYVNISEDYTTNEMSINKEVSTGGAVSKGNSIEKKHAPPVDLHTIENEIKTAP